MSSPCDLVADRAAEWLEADGRGGFASGTVGGRRRRRYHALLLAATDPPGGRVLLVNGFDAWIETAAGRFPLSTQYYVPGVRHPGGEDALVAFTTEPWPTWTFALGDGTRVQQELFVRYGNGTVVLSWTLLSRGDDGPVRLAVRPFLSGRDPHALQHENAACVAQPAVRDGQLVWRCYDGVPAVVALTNGEYDHAPEWIRQFLYEEERDRGLDHVEDLLAPGWFRWTIDGRAAELAFAVDGAAPAGATAETCIGVLRAEERARRAAFPTRLDRSADAYLTQRGAGDGRTIVAGYPWFTDWGRDTFIAIRGLCLATRRFDDARRILLAWAPLVSQGMLPNCFFASEATPEYNTVDAALWYAIAVHEFLSAVPSLAAEERARLHVAVDAILDGYAAGTRFGIRLDDDGLIAAGAPGVQLTWMDAKIGDWVVTPRIGKPVEIQALWLNALHTVLERRPQWREAFERGLASFRKRFADPDRGGLYDVVDVDHRAGTFDATLRPNQIFAVGGLPLSLLDGAAAAAVVDLVERTLWTPLGLRSLAPGEPGYVPHYQGGVRDRDGAYHQGTVWPWLIGAFADAWVRVRGDTPAVRDEARARFLAPLLAHLDRAGLGHVSEIADAEPPYTPRGCPFQAWSVGEVLRLDRIVLATAPA